MKHAKDLIKKQRNEVRGSMATKLSGMKNNQK